MSPDAKAQRVKLPLAVYVRVSREGKRRAEEGRFLSESLQVEAIREYAAAHKIPITEKVFPDIDVSGGKMSRKHLNEVMAGIEGSKNEDGSWKVRPIYGGLIVARLDRFARSLTGALRVMKQIQRAGGELIAIDAPVDMATKEGRLMIGMMLQFAEYFREGTVEGTTKMHAGKVKEGTYLAAVAPAGYSFEMVPTGKLDKDTGEEILKRGNLVPNEHAPAILEAFELRARGGSGAAIRDLLNERGVPTSRGGRWQERTAMRLLRNPAYIGTIRHGGIEKLDDDGDLYTSELHVHEHAHEAIIERPLWNKVQRTLVQGAPRGSSTDKALLAGGLLRCAVCGDRMSLSSNKRDGKPYYFYNCRSETHAPRPTIGQHIVDRYITDQALAKAGTMRGQKPTVDDPAYEAAEAAYNAAVAEVQEMEEMIGTTLPPDSKQVLAVNAAEDALEAARTSGDMLSWVIPHVSDHAAILEATPHDEVELPGGVTFTAITSTHSHFLALPRSKQREFLAGMIESATVKTAGKGAPVPVEERVAIKWKAAA